MALTKLTTDLENVQALSDKPNEIEGLTADELKAKFDKAGTDIKTYINDTLTDELDTALGLKLLASLKAIGTDVTAGTEDTKYVTAKAIKDAAVDLGAWTAYTPTTANLTKGSGTLAAAYCRIGKTIHFRIKFTLAANSAIGTTPYFSLPAAAKTPGEKINSVTLYDANVGYYNGTLDISDGNAVPSVLVASGTYVTRAGLTATLPFTWTTDDYISITGTYEAA